MAPDGHFLHYFYLCGPTPQRPLQLRSVEELRADFEDKILFVTTVDIPVILVALLRDTGINYEIIKIDLHQNQQLSSVQNPKKHRWQENILFLLCATETVGVSHPPRCECYYQLMNMVLFHHTGRYLNDVSVLHNTICKLPTYPDCLFYCLTFNGAIRTAWMPPPFQGHIPQGLPFSSLDF